MGFPYASKLCVQPSFPTIFPKEEMDAIIIAIQANERWQEEWTQATKEAFQRCLKSIPSLNPIKVVQPLCDFLEHWQPSPSYNIWKDNRYAGLEYALISVRTYLEIMEAEHSFYKLSMDPTVPRRYGVQMGILATLYNRLIHCIIPLVTSRTQRVATPNSAMVEYYVRHHTNLLLNIITQRDPISDQQKVIRQRDWIMRLENSSDDRDLAGFNVSYEHLKELQEHLQSHDPIRLMGAQTSYSKDLQNLTAILKDVESNQGQPSRIQLLTQQFRQLPCTLELQEDAEEEVMSQMSKDLQTRTLYR
jgi:hypothetical protein